jgi:hypothetical protein
MTLNEIEAFAYAFGGHTLRQYFQDSYDLVLVLNDGMRWKLDSNQGKRLNQVVNPDLVSRIEAIFPVLANFEILKLLYRQELERPIN